MEAPYMIKWPLLGGLAGKFWIDSMQYVNNQLTIVMSSVVIPNNSVDENMFYEVIALAEPEITLLEQN